VAGYGRIVAEFFDAGQSRTLPWARRPEAAALVAAMADPERGFDGVVVGEYDRAFCGGQYAQMAPLFEHYAVQSWTPEAGGAVDFQAAGHELLMVAMGLASKRESTQTRIRVRTAMAAQAREQGRNLGGRPPYGYRLADAGPHPNKGARRRCPETGAYGEFLCPRWPSCRCPARWLPGVPAGPPRSRGLCIRP
jgi:DNA invertase Pin-like site-specific DNA recombinase